MAISRAVSSLIDLGCLELVPQPAGAGMEDQEGGPPPPERLTRLGWQLSKLPLHPKLGKMLVFASLFGVLHPVATCAATSEGKDVFETPFDPNRRRMSDAARRQLASSMGGYSDDLAALAAVQSYQADRNDACRRYFLSRGSCEGAMGTARQLVGEMGRHGLVGDFNVASRHARHAGAVRLATCLGAYPLVGPVADPGVMNNMQQREEAMRRKKGLDSTYSAEVVLGTDGVSALGWTENFKPTVLLRNWDGSALKVRVAAPSVCTNIRASEVLRPPPAGSTYLFLAFT